jgi:hypothetical protein
MKERQLFVFNSDGRTIRYYGQTLDRPFARPPVRTPKSNLLLLPGFAGNGDVETASAECPILGELGDLVVAHVESLPDRSLENSKPEQGEVGGQEHQHNSGKDQ